MPFITARVVSVVRQNTGQLGFITAGPNQSVLCASLVQLEATVIGDLSQHTFEWEQTFGTPVTLLNPNTLTPSFVNPQTSDIEFTFYVDRNTPFEDSDTVFISRGPQDFAANIFAAEGKQRTQGFSLAKSSQIVPAQLAAINARVVHDAYQYPPPDYSPIYTADDLDRVRNDLRSKYWLMNNIDLSGYSNWNPIGIDRRAFIGELQGNGFVIRNLTITDRVRNSGLFGHLGGGALIENLGVIDANVSGQTSAWYSSILAGSCAGTAGIHRRLRCKFCIHIGHSKRSR